MCLMQYTLDMEKQLLKCSHNTLILKLLETIYKKNIIKENYI